MKKISNYLTYFAIFIFVLMFFIIATVYDLQITSFFVDLPLGDYYSTNIYAIFFEIVGESALYLLLALSFAVIFWATEYYVNNKIKIVFQVATYLICTFISFLGIWRIYGFLGNYVKLGFYSYILIIFISISFVFGFLYIFALRKLKKVEIKKLFWFACLIIFVSIFSVLTTQLLKELFCRVRYRTMSYLVDFSYYQPWYIVGDKSLIDAQTLLGLPSDAFKSFPSGHTVSCAVLFCFWFFPLFFKKSISKPTKFFCYYLPILITCLVGISRMVAGAHFLTDIIFAVFIVAVYIAIFVPYFYYLQYRPRKKNKVKA